MPGNGNNGGDPQNNTETFTKEQVQKMIDEAVTKAKADTTAEFKDHIKKLNEENAAKRIDLKRRLQPMRKKHKLQNFLKNQA